MHEISVFRLYVLRGMYLFIVAGLAVFLWPEVLNPGRHWNLAEGESSCMLAAFSLVCVLGVRYPLQMLPHPAVGGALEDDVAAAGSAAAMEGGACGRSVEACGVCNLHGWAGLPHGALGLRVPAVCSSSGRAMETARVWPSPRRDRHLVDSTLTVTRFLSRTACCETVWSYRRRDVLPPG